MARVATPTGAIATRTMPGLAMLPDFQVLIGAVMRQPDEAITIAVVITMPTIHMFKRVEIILVPAAR